MIDKDELMCPKCPHNWLEHTLGFKGHCTECVACKSFLEPEEKCGYGEHELGDHNDLNPHCCAFCNSCNEFLWEDYDKPPATIISKKKKYTNSDGLW